MQEIREMIQSLFKKNRDLLLLIIIFSLLAFILFKVILVTVVQTGSMKPTLKVGNTAIYNRLAYINKDPQRGEIVSFWSTEFEEYFSKRVIGIPGDTIRFYDGKVIVNDRAIDESEYLSPDTKTYEFSGALFTVPDGHYFMLGDNRMNSYDSRFWGNPYIPFEDIMGRYIFDFDFSIQFDIFNESEPEPEPVYIIVPSDYIKRKEGQHFFNDVQQNNIPYVQLGDE